MPPRKPTKKSKATRKSTRKSTKSATRTPRKCALNRAKLDNGKCSRKIPCMGSNGGSLPHVKRGLDGHCRLRPCGRGRIMNPDSGRCKSTKTKHGQTIALSKRYDDAKRFVAAYERSSYPEGPRVYYDRFDSEKLQRGQNLARYRQGTSIQGRRDRADKAAHEKWISGGERSFLDKLKRNVNWATGGWFGNDDDDDL